MKIKADFVTNSSSSSFIIQKEYLSEKQIEKIKNHLHHSFNMGMGKYDEMDRWFIEDGEEYIKGSTIMDNFDMETFLELIHVDLKKVKWGDY